MKTQKKKYEIKYTEEKESFVSIELNKTDRKKVESAFTEYKNKKLSERTEQEKLTIKLLQLKFIMEDYLKSDSYNENYYFGFFLKEYINRLDKKYIDFADEIDINPVKLSHIINKHRFPSEEIFLRLEYHSNNNFSVLTWFKIAEKDRMFDLVNNKKLRQQEKKHVKHRLEFSI